MTEYLVNILNEKKDNNKVMEMLAIVEQLWLFFLSKISNKLECKSMAFSMLQQTLARCPLNLL